MTRREFGRRFRGEEVRHKATKFQWGLKDRGVENGAAAAQIPPSLPPLGIFWNHPSIYALPPLITLTTDFGSDDAYVAAMKGAMLSIEPSLRLLDVTHCIDPQDILGAAFQLRQVIPYSSPGTIHLVVVDPGVGSPRAPIAAQFGDQYFIGPDNGLLSLILDQREPDALVLLDHPEFWYSSSPSATFHGRDIFGPVAAHLARGRSIEQVGTSTESYRRLSWARPIADEEGIQGWVVHVDRFGNAITNIPRSLLDADERSKRAKCYVGSVILEGIHTTYSDVTLGEPLAIIGSADFLEISVNGGNASTLLSIPKGSRVSFLFGDARPVTSS